MCELTTPTTDERKGVALMWLSYALGDLATARARRGNSLRPRIVAYHARQAALKALTGALLLSNGDVPKTQDLEELRRVLPLDWSVNYSSASLTRLSTYGLETAYAGGRAPVSAVEAATAARQAIAVVRLVRNDFERRGVPTANLAAR